MSDHLLMEHQHLGYTIRLYHTDPSGSVLWTSFNRYGNPVGTNHCNGMLDAVRDAEEHLHTHIWLYGQAGVGDHVTQYRCGDGVYLIEFQASVRPRVIYQPITPTSGRHVAVGVESVRYRWAVKCHGTEVQLGFADTPGDALQHAWAWAKHHNTIHRHTESVLHLRPLPAGFVVQNGASWSLDDLCGHPQPLPGEFT